MKTKSIPVSMALFALLMLWSGVHSAQSQSDQPTASEKTPSVFVPVSSWEFDQVVDGKKVVHDFVIQNKGNAPLNISEVKTA